MSDDGVSAETLKRGCTTHLQAHDEDVVRLLECLEGGGRHERANREVRVRGLRDVQRQRALPPLERPAHGQGWAEGVRGARKRVPAVRLRRLAIIHGG